MKVYVLKLLREYEFWEYEFYKEKKICFELFFVSRWDDGWSLKLMWLSFIDICMSNHDTVYPKLM